MKKTILLWIFQKYDITKYDEFNSRQALELDEATMSYKKGPKKYFFFRTAIFDNLWSTIINHETNVL